MRGRGENRGLSLGELLTAVAILGALSALLFPTFARARENARMAVCLGNVRAVALAVRMYLAESDNMLPPREHRQEVFAYFSSHPGGGGPSQWDPDSPNTEPVCHRARQGNPYLRWPVILDSYVVGREVWQCPNARLQGGAFFINGATDWLAQLKAHQGHWGLHTYPWVCPMPSWPAGWGGEVTDSLSQQRIAVPVSGKGKVVSPAMFLQSIGVNEGSAASMNVCEVADPAWYVICADGGATVDSFTTGTLAYPDLCHLECAGPGDWEADWENCPWSRECGAIAALRTDPELRRPHARHCGGVNIGFLDGHARWFDSEIVIAESPSTLDPNRGHLRGYEPGAPTSEAWDSANGIPPLY